MDVALFQEHFANGGCIRVAEEGVLDDDSGTATGFEHLDEVLHEHICGLGGLDAEVLLDILPL